MFVRKQKVNILRMFESNLLNFGSVLPVVSTGVRAKMCANDVPLGYGHASVVLRSRS